jgi:hypothetical protein
MTGMVKGLVRICAVSGPGTEDEKIITLARSARARVAAAEGAAVRTRRAGRTPRPREPADIAALGVAPGRGDGGVQRGHGPEAAALVSDADAPTRATWRWCGDVGPGAVVFHVGADGAIRATLSP